MTFCACFGILFVALPLLAGGWGRLRAPLLILPRILNHPGPRTFQPGIPTSNQNSQKALFLNERGKKFPKNCIFYCRVTKYFLLNFNVDIICSKKRRVHRFCQTPVLKLSSFRHGVVGAKSSILPHFRPASLKSRKSPFCHSNSQK